MQNYLQKGCKNALTIRNLQIFNKKLVKMPFRTSGNNANNAHYKMQLSSQCADIRGVAKN